MARYSVLITETVTTEYLVEVETENGEDEAKKMAEDIIVNHEDAAEAAIQATWQDKKTVAIV